MNPKYLLNVAIALCLSSALSHAQQEPSKEIDTALNAAYKNLLNRNDQDPSFAAALKNAQLAWLKYVDLHMDSVFPLVEGENPKEVYGSSYLEEYSAEKSKLYTQRIDLLKSMTGGEVNNGNDAIKNAQDPAKKDQALAPLVKGLGINMNFSKLENWFKEQLKDTNLGYNIFNGEKKIFMIANAELLKAVADRNNDIKNPTDAAEVIDRGLQSINRAPSLIMAGKDGSIHTIILQQDIVNHLFNARDINYIEFKKLFLDAYKLDSLQIQISVENTLTKKEVGFSVTTEVGVNYFVDQNKRIIIKKVAQPSSVKKSFN